MNTSETNPFADYPDTWDEEWLRRAIHELNTRKMTWEEHSYFSLFVEKKAQGVWATKRRIEAAVLEYKTDVIKNMLTTGLTVEQAAQLVEVSVEFVEQVQAKNG